ncbi:MAG: protein kinase [Planctomycetaceae bacterium]|nr:protein kinase [Planctomycetaceae bacterium]
MVTVEDFLRRVKGCGLASADDINALVAACPAIVQSDNVKGLATEFVRRGLMTKYQATAALQGRHDALLLGDYLIQDVIGQGGMGTVFKAEHKRLKRIVAVKTLNPSALKVTDAVDRFRREAELIGKLNHRNIVAAFDAGEVRGQHFLAMEYVEGTDLERLVTQQGPLPPDVAAACILQAARGLEYAHTRGILHRDVKPANLLLATKADPPVVKLLDLGLAWIRDSSSATAPGDPAGRLTQNDRIMGTVTYMAPEQALEIHSADQRADIYSLGCTLYFLVAGKAMYPAESVLKQLVAHRESPIPALPRAKPPLNAVLAKMVAKQPEQRYQSMADVIAALERCGVTDAQARGALDLTGATSTDDEEFESYASVSLSKNEALPTSPRMSRKKAQSKKKAAEAANRQRLILGVSATAAVVVIGLMVWLFTSGRGKTTASDAAAVAANVIPEPKAQPDPVVAPVTNTTEVPTAIPPVAADFDVTGEYLSTIAGETWGFQVRRRADETFAIRLLQGGLPGDGWDQRTAYELSASKSDGRIAFDKNPRMAAAFEPDRIAGTNAVGETFVAERTTRRSILLDKPAPPGATVLFDGHNADQWTAGQVTPEGLLLAGTTTTQSFRDFALHLEYRLPTDSVPSAVAGGLLLQGRYEIVIADSFGDEATATSCAAVKGQSAPSVNVSFPRDQWQTLDVSFAAPRFDSSGIKATNARGTIRHNGVVVHDNVELQLNTAGAEMSDSGPIVLGPTAESGVAFRNLWIVETRPAGLLAGNPKSWPEPSDALRKRMASVSGLIHEEFALVHTLPLDGFEKLAEQFQESGYRPVRLRPYATNKAVQTAALWQRDGYEWQLATGSAAELQKQAQQLQAEGLWPVDVAGYAAKNGEEYLSLWARLPEKPAEEARIYPGVRHVSLAPTFADFPNQGFSERVDQAFVVGRAGIMHSTLWWKSPAKTEGWWGDLPYFEGHRKGFILDLCIARGPLTGAPAYAWCSLTDPPPGVEFTELHGLAPDVHLKRCAELLEQGYKPVSIGAAQVNASVPLQTCSLWHRKIAPSRTEQ